MLEFECGPQRRSKNGVRAHGVHCLDFKKHFYDQKKVVLPQALARGGSANVCGPKSVLDLGVVVRPGLDSSGRIVGCLCRGNAVNNTHLDLRRGYVSPETSE